jgi:Tfp pilus assembly protein PilF
MRRSLKAILLAGAVAALSGTALASGGGSTGGGGSPEMPSSSGPQYDPAAEYAKAITALQAKDYKTAAKAADHVTQAAPKSADGWRILGAAKAGSSDWKGARRAYEKAVKLAPDDAMIHAGLGQALGNLKDAKAQAELDWLKAKAQSCGTACPADLPALTGMVESAMAGGSEAPKPGALLENRSLLFAGAKAGDAAYIQAVSLINERRYDEALKSLADAQAVFGPHPDILTYEGYTWRKKGDYARAENYYQQALAIAPNHVGATEYYGELKVARGDIAGARLMLAKLDRLCTYGCADAEELRRWIDAGGDPQGVSRMAASPTR